MNFEPQHNVVRSRHTFVCLDDMLLVLLLILGLGLTACEGRSTGNGSLPPSSDRMIQVNAPVDMSIDPLLPPGASDRPALPGESGRQRTAEGLPILDSKGPNLKQIFRQDIKDPIDRIKRVENAVLEMRQDLDSVLPAINRLVSIEGDIQALTTQLKALLVDENPSLPNTDLGVNGTEILESSPEDSRLTVRTEYELSQNAAPIEGQDSQNKSTVVVSSGDGEGRNFSGTQQNVVESEHNDIQDVLLSLDQNVIDINSIRIGKHPDKVRVVIDSPVSIHFTTDLDSQENILVVDLSGVDVQEGSQETPSNSLIKSISLNKSTVSSPGGQVVFELKKSAQIKRSTMMSPHGDDRRFRILIDLIE